ncbi:MULTISPECIES: glycolate oxidase subunit GlcF [unclassified Caballeronia]|uniref:glycolate oxidase subunit GlcF n=1 Tax=unclassified Caballeronia TaxID=2646786 RepID=UPI0028560E98|nr:MULTISPECIES: glycolate oxidase subunit GlcF [unclassified Caballeronia]MDR5741469.1 glycolate oxidase subunit GlcF [Caballeronia sp. LZ016]MDR5806782.1 glycolate oxidase subunit GlcF [Caballeronia sp. LZ019]
MQTNLSDQALTLPRAKEAEDILRSCVHCGFCNATCPTYQLLGNELDGPRGRIYLIKQMLEGQPASDKTQLHLDRCLTCRNCETTCPSGVKYHALLDIGRDMLEARVERPMSERVMRAGLRKVITRPRTFGALLAAGRLMRGALPAKIGDKIPREAARATPRPPMRHARRMLMLEGCAQRSLSPNTNAATARVLDRLGIGIEPAHEAGCCGAVDYHLNAQDAGLDRARRNIDAWWPKIEAGAEAIIQTASGCGAFIKEYGHLLRNDPAYAAKAARVSELARDIGEVLAALPLEHLRVKADQRVAFHCPCTLQHAQKLGGSVEAILSRLGFPLTSVPDPHLCCGSAGTYAFTQPELSRKLRDNKLDALESGQPDIIATANIGCQTHLGGAGRTAVRHWIEIVDEAIA